MTSQEPQTSFSANVDEMHETEVIVVSTPAPVFVDSTGRRRRVLRRLAYGFGALCMLYGGLVSVSLAGGPISSNAVLPLPDLHGRPDDQVAEERPAPSPAPTVTSPRPMFVTEALPRRPVSATSTLRPDVRRPSAGTARPAPATRPTRRPATPSVSTTTRPVESTTTPTASPSPSPSATTDETDPPGKVPPAPPAPPTGGTGGGSGAGGGGDAPVKAPPAPPAPPVVDPEPAPQPPATLGAPDDADASDVGVAG